MAAKADMLVTGPPQKAVGDTALAAAVHLLGRGNRAVKPAIKINGLRIQPLGGPGEVGDRGQRSPGDQATGILEFGPGG